jgi:hypothetical protein
MQIQEVEPADEAGLAQFLQVARQVYAADPHWVPQSEAAFESLLASAGSTFVRPLLCLREGEVLARAVAILNPGASNELGQPVGYIGFFECLPEQAPAGVAVLLAAEGLLRAQGAVSIQAPRVDNMLMGLVVERFDLPQTVLTPHNPPYYAGILREAGYRVRETLCTYTFERTSAITFPLVRPGFHTRVFNRQNLEAEVQIFHALQQEIFGHQPGWVARSLEEDRQMISEMLPMLDDELVIIAEDRTGRAVGLLVCLPDVYQAYRGAPIDNARAISIGVIRPLVDKGLGVLMGLHLARNLTAKGYRTLEASWVREENVAPQNMLTRRFLGRPGRKFALFEKTL